MCESFKRVKSDLGERMVQANKKLQESYLQTLASMDNFILKLEQKQRKSRTYK